ncbi:MAG: FecR domain-containing protein [Acidobacteriota bacterium]
MSREDRELSAAEGLIDRAASQVQATEPDPQVTAQAAERVWKQLAGGHNARRGMTIVRDGSPVPEVEPVVAEAARKPPWADLRIWGIAAMLIAGIAVTQLVVREFWPSGPSATVQTVDGQLFRVASASQQPIVSGDVVAEGDVIRTGRDGGAVVRLEDGSLVEMRERSEIFVDEGRKGTTIHLERGSVMVEAAEQRQRHLYVATDDCLVSVTGTIFSVNHGTKGSRVSVVEGEVRVRHGGDEDILHPGDQVVTHTFLAPTPVAKDIAWSRGVDGYLELLRQYGELRADLDKRVSGELRYSSRLLDLMPEDTVFFAAAPNVARTLSQTHQVLQDHLDQSPELAEWWADNAASQFQDKVDEAMTALGDLSTFLGDELAVGGSLEDQDVGEVLVLAEVMDADGLRAFIEQKAEELAAQLGDGDGLPLVFVDDPTTFAGGNDSEQFLMWFQGDLAIGSMGIEPLRRVAAILQDGQSNPFVGSPFHASIVALYAEGAEFVVAADLHSMVDRAVRASADTETPFEALGVDNVRHLMLEQKRLAGKTSHRAVMTFDEARHGMASWLAAPASMGALDFVSPEAKLLAAAVFQDPAKLLDDAYGLAGGLPAGLREFEETYGLSLRDDFAASLGGEVAFAIDGPLLPTPAWKLVMEVYDPARFQWSLEQGLVEANLQLAKAGKPELAIAENQVGGRTFYTLPSDIVDVHYTFVEGYLVAAPNRALIDQAIRFRQSGYSITESPKFTALLPQDGRDNFSALVYQDLSGAIGSVAEKLGQGTLTEEQRAAVDAMAQQNQPTLGFAYGDPDRITVAATHHGDFMGSLLLRGLGLKDPAGLEAILGGLFEGS